MFTERSARRRKGSLHSGSALESIHRKHLTLLYAFSTVSLSREKTLPPRELSPRDRDEGGRIRAGVARNARRIANAEYRAITLSFSPLTLSTLFPTASSIPRDLRPTNNTERRGEEEIGEMKLLRARARNHPSRSVRDSARSRRRVLNIQNFPRGRNFRILLWRCVPADGRVWLGFFHDLWLATVPWRGDSPPRVPRFFSAQSMPR